MDADANERGFLPLHRGEALTDGIYAVAMTLLVIELKVPEGLHSADAFVHALLELAPKATAWVLSFFVLALFWLAHHRTFAQLRRADANLVSLNLTQLALVSLMPFSSALVGQWSPLPLIGQAIYSANMALLGLAGWFVVRYVYRHPALAAHPLPRSSYLGATIRIGGVVATSVAAFAAAAATQGHGLGNVVFVLIPIVNAYSYRVERRAHAAERLGTVAA